MNKRSWIKLLLLMFFTGVFLLVYSVYQIGLPEVVNKINLGNYSLSFTSGALDHETSGLLNQHFSYKKNYQVEALDQIEIQTVSDDIQLGYIDGDEVVIEYYGQYRGIGNLKAPEMDIQEDGNLLKVQVNHNSGIAIFAEFNSTLNLLIPRNFKGSLNVKTTSGDLCLSEATLESFIWETTSGDLTHESFPITRLEGEIIQNQRKDLMIETFEITSTSGDVELYGSLGEMKIDTTSGDIYFEGNALMGNINIDTVSGNVDLNGGYGPCLIEYKTISGTRSVTAEGMKILKDEKDYFQAQIGNGDTKINISTTSGDFTFK